ESDDAERDDRRGMSEGHGSSEDGRVARRPALAYEVSRDDRLPVAGAERVRGAPHHGGEQGECDESGRQVLSGDQAGEAGGRRRRAGNSFYHGFCLRGWWRSFAGTGLEPEAGLAHVERAAELLLRVGRELLALVPLRH